MISFFWYTFLCLLTFYLHYWHLLSNYKFLLLIQEIFHYFSTNNSPIITPITFLFFPFSNGLFNLKCQTLLQDFCNGISKYHLFLWIQWNCLYPYNTILVFQHILALHNYTKTHASLFYWFLILIDLNKQFY